MTFGERVAQRRLELGLSQREVADLCETVQERISRLECGYIPNPGLTLIRHLAKALHTSADYLIGMYEASAPSSPSTPHATTSRR